MFVDNNSLVLLQILFTKIRSLKINNKSNRIGENNNYHVCVNTYTYTEKRQTVNDNYDNCSPGV